MTRKETTLLLFADCELQVKKEVFFFFSLTPSLMPSIFLFSMKALCFNVSQCKGQIIYVLGFYSSILISLPHQNSWS